MIPYNSMIPQLSVFFTSPLCLIMLSVMNPLFKLSRICLIYLLASGIRFTFSCGILTQVKLKNKKLSSTPETLDKTAPNVNKKIAAKYAILSFIPQILQML